MIDTDTRDRTVERSQNWQQADTNSRPTINESLVDTRTHVSQLRRPAENCGSTGIINPCNSVECQNSFTAASRIQWPAPQTSPQPRARTGPTERSQGWPHLWRRNFTTPATIPNETGRNAIARPPGRACSRQSPASIHTLHVGQGFQPHVNQPYYPVRAGAVANPGNCWRHNVPAAMCRPLQRQRCL